MCKNIECSQARVARMLHENDKLLITALDAMKELPKLGMPFVHEDNLESILREILNLTISISGADFCNIQLLDPESSDLKIAAHHGFPKWWLNCLEMGKGTCVTALRSGKRVIVEDIEQSPIFIGTPALEIQLKAGVRACQSTPLVSRSGKLFGMFSTYYKTSYKPDDRAIRLLDMLASYAADLLTWVAISKTLHESETHHKVVEHVDVERHRFFDVLETLPVMICLLRSDYQFVFTNRSFREKFGDAIGQYCYEFCFGRTSPCELCKVYKVIETGQHQHWQGKGPDGSIIDVEAFPFTDIDGSPMILEMKIDITEQKKTEELSAKMEIVRKQEIHHRIKNNLQIISSLLDLQADKFNNKGYIKDSEVLEAFRVSQDRIISMALIHEELYKSGKLDKLDFSSYIKKLADNLFLAYGLENENISLNIDMEENFFFDIDTVIPLGIIVNELVSNSLKHAFQGKDKGKIQIKFCRKRFVEFENKECKSTSFVLIVSDNGMGIPELDFEDIDSLGMQLVISLVNQLDGEFELKRGKGTEFTMQFTLIEKN